MELQQQLYAAEAAATAGAAAAAGGAPAARDVSGREYFEVPFEEALELVRARRVFVRGGVAFVPRRDMISIVVGAFRAHLSAQLLATSRALPTLEEDERLLPMLTTLSKQYLGQEYGTKGALHGAVTAAQIPGLAAESFPLCMRHCQDHLATARHLKHGGRMQYGLFLKGIGLTLEEALLFWRSAFAPAVTGEQFDKRYAYNIRHNYGKEGKRTDYTPYSCMKVIRGAAPSAGSMHRCSPRRPSFSNPRPMSVSATPAASRSRTSALNRRAPAHRSTTAA